MAEYKDLEIPLGIEVNEQLHTNAKDAAVRAEIDRRVLAALQGQGQEGWTAESPTDVETLLRQRRFKTKKSVTLLSVLFGGGGKTVYQSVTVRLKRDAR